MKVILHIESGYESKTVTLDDELSIGRTPQASLMLPDSGLSRVNTTIFRDDDEVLIVDESSTNGTFLNGERIDGPPRRLKDGDEIKIGTSTRIRVEMEGGATIQPVSTEAKQETPEPTTIPWTPPGDSPSPAAAESKKPPMILIAAGLMTFLIVAVTLVALLIVSRSDSGNNNGKPAPAISATSRIPMRVIDPLGGEDEGDLDDLVASWEVEEKPLDAGSLTDVTVGSADKEETYLNVPVAFWTERKAKSFETRNGEVGIRPAGLNVPKELFGDGVIKQKAKLKLMNDTGYKQPMDFVDLADKRLKRELIEMPMATQSYYLEVGGSASEDPFSSFTFQGGKADVAPGSPKYQILQQLASNFAGQKYDLNNPADRKQMRIRLLRMFNQRAQPVLQEVAEAYLQKYNRPLRVTSLTRSMDYQIGLNATNANSFKVRGEGSLPPHTSGCAFDLARKHMTAEEQNFVMQKLAQMEDAGKLDALIEYGENACFHIFIYFDGIAPKM